MEDALNRFMAGKKKYSASVVIPLIVTAITLLVSDPARQSTLIGLVNEFMPTLIALIGGIAYTIVEGINDNTRAKNTTVSTPANGLVSHASFMPSQPLQVSSQPAPASRSAPAPRWDLQAFDTRVKEKAILTYGALNPSTELYQALNEGQGTPAEHIEHVEAYWDYIVMKADARFASVWGYSFREAAERVAEPGCPARPSTCGSFSNLKHKALSLGEQFYIAYLDYDNAMTTLQNVRVLAGMVHTRGFDWKSKLAPSYSNLYYAGELAPELLK